MTNADKQILQLALRNTWRIWQERRANYNAQASYGDSAAAHYYTVYRKRIRRLEATCKKLGIELEY